MVTATCEEGDMPRSSPPVEEKVRPEDSPVVWFSEMLIADNRGDFPRASEAQRQLARLGWDVTRRKAPRSERGTT
jgi:hypothetical protein